jgi:pimeloyl-ACP methyl ester carboxylesterase
MFTVIGAVVVVLVAALAVRVIFRNTWFRPVPDQARPGTVLLVPGYGGNGGSLQQLANVITAVGRTAVIVTLPDGGTGDLHRQADAVEDAVEEALKSAPSVDVIGYSAGGVVARLWVEEHDGRHKARRVVTLGSPQHGAKIAAAGAAALPGACPVACQQLAPGSALLDGLSNSVPRPPEWLSVWTANDETVTPPNSAILDGATNVEIQQECPGRVVSHGELPSDDYVTSLVLAAIAAEPIQTADVGC